jgi:hypothetical protein
MTVVDPISAVFFCRIYRKMECTKIYDPPEMAAGFYATPHFQVHKKV